uniref:Uncharacterized protein n=1 Tax=Pinguiococcus pyrenoidosus TaxID=172671 RepID=A0A7R9UA49_9STRA
MKRDAASPEGDSAAAAAPAGSATNEASPEGDTRPRASITREAARLLEICDIAQGHLEEPLYSTMFERFRECVGPPYRWALEELTRRFAVFQLDEDERDGETPTRKLLMLQALLQETLRLPRDTALQAVLWYVAILSRLHAAADADQQDVVDILLAEAGERLGRLPSVSELLQTIQDIHHDT